MNGARRWPSPRNLPMCALVACAAVCILGCSIKQFDFGARGESQSPLCGTTAATSASSCPDAGTDGGRTDPRPFDPISDPRDAATDTAPADTDAASPTDAGDTPELSECNAGDCFWSLEPNAECDQTGRPDERFRPGQASSNELGDIYLALTRLRLGQTNRAGEEDEDAWQELGLDLDGVCTNACDGAPTDQVSCQTPSGQIPFDGLHCRDNTFGRLQAVAAKLPNLGDLFGITEEQVNCSLRRGSYNILVRLSGYNGEADDDHVRVDFYTSLGLAGQRDFHCPYATFAEDYPTFLASQPWLVDSADVTEPAMASGVLPDASLFDDQAYVRHGYLVARLREDAQLRLAGDRADFPGFVLVLQQGFYTGKLVRRRDASWSIEDGLIAGRMRRGDLLSAFHAIGVCPGVGIDFVYDGVVRYLDENADLRADGEGHPSLACDAVSVALGFEAGQATPGEVVPARPVVDCCKIDNAGSASCPVGCGDGRVTVGAERCDSAIPAGQPGACPTMCQSGDPCRPRQLVGEGCQRHCVDAPVPGPMNGDGCCPQGGSPANDDDCLHGQCGDGSIDAPAETCDPPGSCPTASTCVSPDVCELATFTGSPESCNARCDLTPITACVGGDLCCPQGCDHDSDNDCPIQDYCGNGTIDFAELCDGDCPTDCDDLNVCTVDSLMGHPSTCNVRCVNQPITRCVNDDGCCPQGCSANTDSDCGVVCGNAVLEAGEQCDDSNSDRLDGCYQCRVETPASQCAWLAQNRKTTPECQACQCSQCATETVACENSADSQENALCAGVLTCAFDNGCAGDSCLCGQDSAFLCTLGPTGPCVEEIRAAAMTSDLLTILSRQADPQYPAGRAHAVSECLLQQCQTACGL